MSQACHRSLYSYQLRTALALAIENPHVAVTFLPLACTGATIENGVLDSQRARELNCAPDENCPSTVPAQMTQLRAISRDRTESAAGPQPRSRAAHRRRERHRFLRAGGQRHHRCDRERVLFHSMISSPESRRERAHPRAAGEFREVAHGVEADGRRRSLARRVRLLRQSCAASRRLRVRRRSERLRRASVVQGGR